jgi:hypothetical protein
MGGPILGESLELVKAVVLGVVPFLQVQQLLQLVAEQSHLEMMTMEGGAELTPCNLMISG